MNDTKDAIMVISDKVHKALSKARSVIIDILHNAAPMDKQLESIKRTFYLVRLLNDYNEILGKDANRGMNFIHSYTSGLSKHFMYSQFRQASLSGYDKHRFSFYSVTASNS